MHHRSSIELNSRQRPEAVGVPLHVLGFPFPRLTGGDQTYPTPPAGASRCAWMAKPSTRRCLRLEWMRIKDDMSVLLASDVDLRHTRDPVWRLCRVERRLPMFPVRGDNLTGDAGDITYCRASPGGGFCPR